MTKVSKDLWAERMNNLNVRRSKEVIKNSVAGVDDYRSHINKCFIGKTVLDIGCGSQIIKSCLPPEVYYTGIDPFPIDESVINMEIENCLFQNGQFDTVYAFAMLDNVYDLEQTLFHMKRVASKNVVFLTGVNIEPDQYHTIKITEEMLIEEMKPFTVGYKEYLHPKIMLIEFKK